MLLERAVLDEFCKESQNGVGGILNFGLHLSLKTFTELGCKGETRKKKRVKWMLGQEKEFLVYLILRLV